MERFSSLSIGYYTSASAAIVCFALDDRGTFDRIPQHIRDILDQRTWSETNKIFLCGTRLDAANGSVTELDVRRLCEQFAHYQVIRPYYVSTKRHANGAEDTEAGRRCRNGEDGSEAVREMFVDVARRLARSTGTSRDAMTQSIRLRPVTKPERPYTSNCC